MPTRTRTLKPPKEVLKPAVKNSRVLQPPQSTGATQSKKTRTLSGRSALERLVSLPTSKLGLPATESELNKLAAPDREDSSSSTETEDLSVRVKTRARVLRHRRRNRLRKYLDTAFDANTAGTTFLETQAVTAPVQQYYATELEAFRIHAAKHGYNLDNPDLAIAQYLNSLFWKGEQPHKGEKFRAAWLHRYPDFGRIGSRKLPRSWRALKGWRRLCPARSRLPMPLCVWASPRGPLRAPVRVDVRKAVRTASLRDAVSCETHRFSSGRVGSPVGADLSSRRRPRQASSTFPCLWTALT